MKNKLALIIGGILLLTSIGCSTEFDPCSCYEKALNASDTSELDQECQDLIQDMDEAALKEASNKCFTDNVSDLIGGGAM